MSRLACEDFDCSKLPLVHVNLELWIALGATPILWISPEKVADNGPLGPISHWATIPNHHFAAHVALLNDSFCKDLPNVTKSTLTGRCDIDLCNRNEVRQALQQLVRFPPSKTPSVSTSTYSRLDYFSQYPNTWSARQPNSIFDMTGEQDQYLFEHSYAIGENYDSLINRYWFNSSCRFASQQATKLSWAKLSTAVPLVHQLIDQMHFSQNEFDEILESANLIRSLSPDEARAKYRDIACQWIRFSPNRWKPWTEGWNQKQNLTIAGLFTFYGKWVVSGLDRVAEQALNFVNTDEEYFGNSEYALTMEVHNLSCSQDIVINDYFDLLTTSKTTFIGVIAALCSDSIQPVIEIANFRRQIVVSPTVESVKFVNRNRYPYFFRTVPSMSHVGLILIRLFTKWGWRRLTVFRKDDHFYDPRVFQSNGIDVIGDFVVKENQLTYKVVYNGLQLMIERKSRIFILEYFSKGTAIILCAAYRLGMQFDSGYVWFLNPWLSEYWWQYEEVRPPECTYEEMKNITSWTFTIGHQLITVPMVETFVEPPPASRFRRDLSLSLPTVQPEKHSTYARLHQRFASHLDSQSSDSKPETGDRSLSYVKSFDYDLNNYAIHTYESVIVLASSLVYLLRQNSSAMSVFDSPAIAEMYRKFVSTSDFDYVIFNRELHPPQSSQPDDTNASRILANAIDLASHLRFNSLNERFADYWVLRQHQVNRTVPILLWFFDPDLFPDDLGGADLLSVWGKVDLSSIAISEQFAQLTGERWLGDVNWSRNKGPPGDGSEPENVCTFGFIGRAFGISCLYSSVIGAIFIVSFITCGILVVFVVYHRRKLKETERRIRQPYEQLCAELKDIDIPSSNIVLNRHIGQGAFGMVYGGEAKCNGKWEAVAVKVIGGKATYKGKTDFLSEAKLMRSLNHRNIVRLVGICLYPEEDHLYLIMEFMLNGDLKTYLLSRRVLAQQFPDDEAVCPSTLTAMATDIAEGMAYLHRSHLIHRDIACRNCLVGPDRVIKIGDFGLTRVMDKVDGEGYYRFMHNCELPIRWMSPEAVQWGVFSMQSDMWSYGIALYEIITFGVFPYDGLCDMEVVERVKRKNFSIVDFLPVEAQSSFLAKLILQCCQHQWQHRPVSMEQIIQALQQNPGCVRPYLTDAPPKPNSDLDALKFQPGAGACIMSRNTLASDDPTLNVQLNSGGGGVVGGIGTSENSHGLSMGGCSSARGFLSMTAMNTNKSALASYRSNDSFGETTHANPLRVLFLDNRVGRRRHKTTDGLVSNDFGQSYVRRGTSTSLGVCDCACHNSDFDACNKNCCIDLTPVGLGDANNKWKSCSKLRPAKPNLKHLLFGGKLAPQEVERVELLPMLSTSSTQHPQSSSIASTCCSPDNGLFDVVDGDRSRLNNVKSRSTCILSSLRSFSAEYFVSGHTTNPTPVVTCHHRITSSECHPCSHVSTQHQKNVPSQSSYRLSNGLLMSRDLSGTSITVVTSPNSSNTSSPSGVISPPMTTQSPTSGVDVKENIFSHFLRLISRPATNNTCRPSSTVASVSVHHVDHPNDSSSVSHSFHTTTSCPSIVNTRILNDFQRQSPKLFWFRNKT